ncbi:hypothetical protein NFB56_15965 [Yersinia ruckeri]|uniref:hypothetical protein n=1 Tax=Yersinia ruckeri TaxID=29486 RepID=UPI002238C19E|nr:hypothetical protein [Yersinia ruckeri]MCW6550335.1 hypothetical protein [Yersinia ruckeri]
MITITLNQIRAASPCTSGWKKVLDVVERYLDGTATKDELIAADAAAAAAAANAAAYAAAAAAANADAADAANAVYSDAANAANAVYSDAAAAIDADARQAQVVKLKEMLDL